jgi:hypothetical protein
MAQGRQIGECVPGWSGLVFNSQEKKRTNVTNSVVDPDPVGAGTFCRIRIRSRIRNEFYT